MTEILIHKRYTTVISFAGIPPQNKSSFWLQWVSPNIYLDRFVYQYHEFKYSSPQPSWDSISSDIYSHIHNHPESERCYFEVIPHNWNRFLCFDIDDPKTKNTNDLTIIQVLIPAIVKWITDKKMSTEDDENMESLIWVWSSCRPNKLSYHLTLTDFYFPSNKHTKQAYYEVLSYVPEKYHEFIDPSIYKTTQSWWLGKCIKRGIPYKYHKKLIIPDLSSLDSDLHLDFTKSFSAMVDTEIHRPANLILNEEVLSASLKRRLPSFTQHTSIPNDISPLAQPAINLLNKYNSTHNISNDPVFIYYSHRANLINLKRVCAALCPLCDRIHEHDHAYLLITGKDQSIYFYCHRSPTQPGEKSPHIDIGDLTDKVPNPPLFLPPRIDESYEQPFVLPIKDHLLAHRTLILSSHLGTGKTRAIIEFIKEFKPSSIIHIGVRQLYNHNIFGEYSLYNIPFSHYQDPTLSDYLGDIPYLIIQFESVHRVIHPKTNSVPSYGLVVGDEIETLLIQHTSHGTIKYLRKTLYAIHMILSQATYVIATDAFLSELSQCILSSIRPSTFTLHNTYKPPQQTAIRMKSFNALLSEFISHLSSGKKCAFFSASKQKINIITSSLTRLGKKVLLYTGDTSEEERKELQNVREYWKAADAVIFSPVLTVGVSYDLSDFDTNFAYFAPNTCRVRDMFQSIHRIRSFSSKKLYFSIGKYVPGNGSENIQARGTIPEIKDQIYKHRKQNVRDYMSQVSSSSIQIDNLKEPEVDIESRIDDFLINEDIPQFYLDIQAYAIAEYNSTLFRFEESIYQYFRFCNFVVVEGKTRKYPKLKLDKTKDDRVNFHDIEVIADVEHCLAMINNSEVWKVLTEGLRSYPYSYEPVKCVINVLLSRQHYGIITAMQKLILSKYFMTIMFKRDIPMEMLLDVWNKYWSPEVGNKGHYRLETLIYFVQRGTVYRPYDNKDTYISMNGSNTRLQVHADKILKLMKLGSSDLENGRTYSVDELMSVFEYLARQEIEKEIRDILRIYIHKDTKRVDTAYDMYMKKLNSLDNIINDSIDLQEHILLLEYLQNRPDLANIIKVLFTIGHITQRRPNCKTKIDHIESFRIQYKQLYKNVQGGMKQISDETLKEFEKLIFNDSYVRSLNILLVPRNIEHDNYILVFKLLVNLLEFIFGITLSQTTDRVGHFHRSKLSSIIFPPLNFVKYIKL